MKSVALLGSARGLTMAVGLGRVKFIAVVLGPIGVGLLGTFDTIVMTAVYISCLGVSSSGVREVAIANAGGDRDRTARTAAILERISWGLGWLGVVAVASLAWPISQLTFNNHGQAWSIIALAPAVAFTTVLASQRAVIQGTNRIADLAQITILSAVIQALGTIGFVSLWGERGIAVSFSLTTLATLAISKWYVKRTNLPPVKLDFGETIRGSGPFIRLGLGLTNALLLSSLVTYATRAAIARDLGLVAVGIYVCAFDLSGKFVGFVLDAMRTDFYPKISALANDHTALNRLVNQQTEIVLLMALPGLLATMTLAPWLVPLVYSGDFHQAPELLRWFVLGCLARVIWAPMGYVRLAKGRGLLFFLSEAGINAFTLGLTLVMLHFFGLLGAALAYVGSNFFQTLVLAAISRRLTGFAWSAETARLLVFSCTIAVTCTVTSLFLSTRNQSVLSGTAVLAVSAYSIRQLALRLGTDHRALRFLARLPLFGFLLPATPRPLP